MRPRSDSADEVRVWDVANMNTLLRVLWTFVRVDVLYCSCTQNFGSTTEDKPSACLDVRKDIVQTHV